MDAVGEHLYYEATKADNAWSALLQKQFGNLAGTVRYTKRGRGEAETPLRAAYEAFRDTSVRWIDYMQGYRS